METIFLILVPYLLMEAVAWLSHKYVMHGFLWRWHRDHHVNDLRTETEKNSSHCVWEKNDLFFLIYAAPTVILMIIGFLTGFFPLVLIAIGITLYGFTYFVLHEIVYHRRMRIPFLQNRHNRYIRALIRAHRGHHHPKGQTGFNSFGLLVFPRKYFKESSS